MIRNFITAYFHFSYTFIRHTIKFTNNDLADFSCIRKSSQIFCSEAHGKSFLYLFVVLFLISTVYTVNIIIFV